jgi:hypothetical protein
MCQLLQAEIKKKLVEEEFPKYFGMFAKLLKDNGSNGYFVGNEVIVSRHMLNDIIFIVDA